jgi:hypothetical protein
MRPVRAHARFDVLRRFRVIVTGTPTGMFMFVSWLSPEPTCASASPRALACSGRMRCGKRRSGEQHTQIVREAHDRQRIGDRIHWEDEVARLRK